MYNSLIPTILFISQYMAYNKHMSAKHKESALRRWAHTSPEERKRLGNLHRQTLKKYWSTVTPEQRSARGRHAALVRHGKIRPLS